VSQQINLFNPIFLKQKKYFSALTMAQGLGMILAGSIAVAGYARVQLSALDAQAEATANQLKLSKAQLAKVSAEYAPRQTSKSLESEIARMEDDVRSQQQAVDIVQRGALGNTSGYSEYLRAFSRQIVGGLWLTSFTIEGAGTDVELRGRALKPELVPSYIGRLKQEPIMKGKSFSTLAMDVPEIDVDVKPEAKSEKAATGTVATRRALAGYIEFLLKSTEPGAEQAEAAAPGQAGPPARAMIDAAQPKAGAR
jgi:Fimbrial assembly protein (PilN)